MSIHMHPQDLHPAGSGAAAWVAPANEGDARWWFGVRATVKADAKRTDGQLTVVEIEAPPNVAAPLHVHHREDEGFWILDGSIELHVGDAPALELAVGDLAWGPRGIPHRYTVGPQGVRMLFLFTPAGFEDLIDATSVPAATAGPPPEDLPPGDLDQLAATVQRFGCELLG